MDFIQFWDTCINHSFDSKIGIWPFITCEPAQRSIQNWPRGNMVTKLITSVTADVYHNFLTEKSLTVISENSLRNHRGVSIKLQQYKVPVHIKLNNLVICATSRTTGLEIHLVCQPPNRPTLNFIGLLLFNSVQYLHNTKATRNIGHIIRYIW